MVNICLFLSAIPKSSANEDRSVEILNDKIWQSCREI